MLEKPERPQQDSVLDQVRPAPWSNEDAIAYEVAIEGINHAVGVYSARIAAAERRPAPDPMALRALRAAQSELVQQRRALRPEDQEAVMCVQQECAVIIAEFRAAL